MKKVTVGDWKFNMNTVKYIMDILSSGRLTYGKYSKALEKQFSYLHKCDYGVLSNSGTSSLQVAIQALKEIHQWRDGDEVIVPATTSVTTINAVLHNNLIPVLVDIDELTYNINPDLIQEKITERTKLIIPVHLFGQSANMTAINQVAMGNDLHVIEDSCETALATHNGQSVGSMSDIGVFSFYMSHILTAGVGGMAITNNSLYAKKMRQIVNHGWDRKVRPVDAPDFSLDEIRSRYYFTSIGHSYRISEFEAAVALSQIDDLGLIVAQRQQNAARLTEGLKHFPLQLPTIDAGNTHSFMMYPIVMQDESKWGIVEFLESEGIETGEMLPLTNQPIYQFWNENDYLVSKMINENGFYVGCHQYLDEDDIDKIIDAVDGYFLASENAQRLG